nr:LysR substrate-binding domain-containing protein [Rhodovibrio salinarum]
MKALRLFMAVARTRSFVAAAEAENTVQSNVTAHVKKLETELGVRLLRRQPGDVQLTSAGRRLLEHAEAICQRHDAAIDEFVTGGTQVRGRLRIGAMETTAAMRLPPMLTAFQQANPTVDVVLSTGPSAQLLDRLQTGELDAAFVAATLPGSEFEQKVVFRERLVLVSGRPLMGLSDRETLLRARFYAFPQGCSYRRQIDRLLNRLGLPPARVSEMGSLDAILGSVAAGLGFAVLPAGVVETFRERYPVYAIDFGQPDEAEMDTYLIAPRVEVASPAVRSFVEFFGTQSQGGAETQRAHALDDEGASLIRAVTKS